LIIFGGFAFYRSIEFRAYESEEVLARVGTRRRESMMDYLPPPSRPLYVFLCFPSDRFYVRNAGAYGAMTTTPCRPTATYITWRRGGGVCREKKQNRKATLFMHGPSARPPYPPCVRARYILHPHHSPALCGWRSNNDRKYSESRNTRVCLVGARGQRNNLNAE
jgi:hypothetical protein